MKIVNKFICIIIVCVCHLNILAQSVESIQICLTKQQYTHEDSIYFTVKNKLNHRLFIRIAVQKKDKNDWVEVLDDIFRTESRKYLKVTQALFLNDTQETNIKWTPLSGMIGCYRFEFMMGDSISKLENSPQYDYSIPFIIENKPRNSTKKSLE